MGGNNRKEPHILGGWLHNFYPFGNAKPSAEGEIYLISLSATGWAILFHTHHDCLLVEKAASPSQGGDKKNHRLHRFAQIFFCGYPCNPW